MTPSCSRSLMQCSAGLVYLRPRCVLGDILPHFFRTDRLTFVGPAAVSGNDPMS